MHSSTPRDNAHRESEYQGAITDRRDAQRRFTDEPASALGQPLANEDGIKLFRQLLKQHFSSPAPKDAAQKCYDIIGDTKWQFESAEDSIERFRQIIEEDAK